MMTTFGKIVLSVIALAVGSFMVWCWTGIGRVLLHDGSVLTGAGLLAWFIILSNWASR